MTTSGTTQPTSASTATGTTESLLLDSITTSSTIHGRDVGRHMRTLGTWVRWDQTVDTFRAGDPEPAGRG